MLLRFIHTVALSEKVLSVAGSYLIVWTHTFCLAVDRHLGSCCLLAIVSNTAVNVDVQLPISVLVFPLSID